MRRSDKSASNLFFAIFLVFFGIPYLLYKLVSALVTSSAKKGRSKILLAEKNNKETEVAEALRQIDTAPPSEFPKRIAELLKGYSPEINYVFDFSCQDISMIALFTDGNIGYICLQSYEDINIATMRRSVELLGRHELATRCIITNRKFTPKAREYGENAYVSLLDRDALIEAYSVANKVNWARYDVNRVRYCPKCRSQNIALFRKGYDYNYAWGGAMLGIKGSRYIAGFDRKRVMGHCNDCGKEWETDNYYLN